ncbi:MAG: AIR synthase-related protein, partial [bacterium]
GNDVVAKLHMNFLHDGIPRQRRQAVWSGYNENKVISGLKKSHLGKDLKEILSSYNVCSKEWIVRQYDHEVQGQTVVKPLQGPSVEISGPGDAAVIWPYTVAGDREQGTGNREYKGIVLSCGLNPEFGKIDPYWMAASAIDEALRNAVAVGADIEKIALLDNFCWGNPNRPEQLGGIVRASMACYDMAKLFGTPFISGKDSLHNEYSLGGKLYSIPPALLISAVGVINDIRKTITMYLKAAGNLIYVLGVTKNEMGGSHYSKIKSISGGVIPKVDAGYSRNIMVQLNKAIERELITSCHDCSEGGIGVALAEMAIAGDKGVNVSLSEIPVQEKMSDMEILFSESNSRFIVEVKPQNVKEFEKTMAGLPVACIGNVAKGDKVLIEGSNNKNVVNEKVSSLSQAWRKTLNW